MLLVLPIINKYVLYIHLVDINPLSGIHLVVEDRNHRYVCALCIYYTHTVSSWYTVILEFFWLINLNVSNLQREK